MRDGPDKWLNGMRFAHRFTCGFLSSSGVTLDGASPVASLAPCHGSAAHWCSSPLAAPFTAKVWWAARCIPRSISSRSWAVSRYWPRWRADATSFRTNSTRTQGPRSRLLRSLNETSALISVGAKLHAAVVRSIEVQLIAAARAIRGVAIDGGVNPHLLQARGNSLRIVIVHADANVIDRAWICQFVNAEKSVAES